MMKKKTSPANSGFMGTYFIPKSPNPSHKLKYVMYKKKNRRNLTNPELEVRMKYKAKKMDEGKKTKFQILFDGS